MVYICLHLAKQHVVNVGTYTSPMDPMGMAPCLEPNGRREFSSSFSPGKRSASRSSSRSSSSSAVRTARADKHCPDRHGEDLVHLLINLHYNAFRNCSILY